MNTKNGLTMTRRRSPLAACLAFGLLAACGMAQATPPVIDEGDGWQLVLIQPQADDDGLGALSGEPVPMVMVDSAQGLAASPLPESVKQELAPDFAEGATDVSMAVHYDIAEAIADGTAETEYAEFLEPDEPGEAGASAFGCGTHWRHRTRNYSKSFEGIHYSRQFGSGGFTGNIDIDAPISGSGQIEVEYAFKKTSYCLPYTVKFVHARAQAEVNVEDTLLQAQGRARYETAEREVLATPTFSQAFSIGPVPVVLGVEFPIGAGYGLEAAAEADITLSSRAAGSMQVDVLCTTDGCAKNPDGNNTNTVSFTDLVAPGGVTGSVSVQVDLKPYVFVEARAYLYHPSVASAGVGAEVSAPSRLFYHHGSCGPDPVSGGYVDVGAQIEFYWNATVIGSDRFNWLDTPIDGFGPFRKVDVNRFLRGGRAHKALRAPLYFGGFGAGTSPLTPVITAPATVTQGEPAGFSIGKRPCLPLEGNLNYSVNWGDGSTPQSLSGAAASPVQKQHTFATAGNKTVTATLIGDGDGRAINRASSRTIDVDTNPAPPVPATISVPASDADGSFAVSWSSSGGASSYKLFRRSRTGSTWGTWTQVKNVTGTSTSLSAQPFGTSRYGVRACNAYSCSAIRESGDVTIGVIPAAPSLTVTSAMCYGLNDASWSAPSGATSYRLYTSAGTNPNNAGEVYSGPNRGYALNVTSTTNVWVKACGTGGCSGFSAMDTASRFPGCN